MYKLPERRGGGGGGGGVIWAMPERKHSFLHEVFPKIGRDPDFRWQTSKSGDGTKSGFIRWTTSISTNINVKSIPSITITYISSIKY